MFAELPPDQFKVGPITPYQAERKTKPRDVNVKPLDPFDGAYEAMHPL